MAKKDKYYLDTSVIGGYYDEEFRIPTRTLFESMSSNRVVAVVSNLVLEELEKAPQQVRELLLQKTEFQWELIIEDEESKELASDYLKAGIVSERFRDDCRHVALATVNNTDTLLSWNFKHIVQLEKIRGFNAVNLRLGYQSLEIRSPLEVIYRGE